MIKNNTVLILGAGASEPYGFPLGASLVDQICAELLEGGDTAIMSRLAKLGFENRREVVRFASDLRSARPYSIDAFIEMRQEFRDIGKAAIADVLLRAEATSTVDTAPATVDWYRYLFNKFLLLRNRDYFTSQAHRLTVVTFNFDRSFERALFSYVRAGLGVTPAAARQLVTEIQIHHIHGLLGEPDWIYCDSEDGTPYGASETTELEKATRTAIRRIKIVDEEIERSVLEDVAVALQNAVFVYFIGFGFDERNLAKLGTPGNVRNATAVGGTAFGWSIAERMPVHRHFGDRQVALYPVDSIGFLRQNAEALFD